MRQFISSEFPNKDGLITVTGKDFRYLYQVLRIKIGDMLAVRFSDGSLQNTTVCKILENLKKIELQVCSFDLSDFNDCDITRGTKAIEIQNEEQSVEYTLFQFIAKPVKMEQIIRQAVECGVRYIVPVKGEYSQNQNIQSLSHSKKERIERLVREARQQSGSPVSSEVLAPLSLEECVEWWKNNINSEELSSCALFLWERSEKTESLKKIFLEKNCKKIKKIAIVVGSEGGISPKEADFLLKMGFKAIHFPGNILRCETAALYGIAAVQSFLNQ